MSDNPSEEPGYTPELRLLLEELVCEICRFAYKDDPGLTPESVLVQREYYLGKSKSYADILVTPPDGEVFVIEVKFGYSPEMLQTHLRRKYAEITPQLATVQRIILVVDTIGRADWPQLHAKIRECVHPSLVLDVWDEERIIHFLHTEFSIDVSDITPETLRDVRHSIDMQKGYFAFGGPSLEEYEHTPLNSTLLWHFSLWKLQRLRKTHGVGPREMLPPGMYRKVVVILADLCSFSRYVRDTPDCHIVRECLTSFYSKVRSQIIYNGGMLYQFVGDEVVGLFGIPESSGNPGRAAMNACRSLVSIGNSVSNSWQRQIDRQQSKGGIHIGMALGDLQIVSLGPYSRTRVGAVGDCINVAARLMAEAGPSEVVVTNSFYQSLDVDLQAGFEEAKPVEAKNVGCIKAWKLSLSEPA